MRTAAVAAGIGLVVLGVVAWFVERPRAGAAGETPVPAAAAAPAPATLVSTAAATDAPDAQSERLIVYKTPT